MKRTPLFAAHQKLGGKLIEFGGWEMPVQYTSITDEHLAVRKAGGLFDISHMGEVAVHGPAAETFLNLVLTNDVRKLTPGLGQYTILCNELGGAIDDLYLYRLAAHEYLLIINASRIEADLSWLRQQLAAFHRQPEIILNDISDSTSAVALQGPVVSTFIDQCFSGQVSSLKKNQITRTEFRQTPVWVSRTGYTGEDGFEIVAPAGAIEPIWDELLRLGAPLGVKPAGLGARDTLRTEVCYPLYGQELNEQTTPIEAGLGFFVSLDKPEFNGRSALANQKATGPAKKLVAFKMTSKSAPPRPHYPLYHTGASATRVGEVTSGTQSPSLGYGIGMGYVPPDLAKPGTLMEVEIRSTRAPAQVVPKPIYRKAD
jgi:aminomethyltransferase